jgi:hypothetical protein
MTATVNLTTARLTSEPTPVTAGVHGDIHGGGDFALAADGTIVFIGGGDPAVGKLAWLDHSGHVDTLPLPAADYRGWNVSPDGKRVVTLIQTTSGVNEIRVFDMVRGITTKLELPAPHSGQPVWTSDGRSVLIAVRQNTADSGAVVRIPADGGLKSDTIFRGFTQRIAVSPVHNTIVLLLRVGSSDLSLLSGSMDGAPFKLLTNPVPRQSPSFSPDRR